MKIISEHVQSVNRTSIPKENETISDDYYIEKMIPLIYSVEVYMRDKKECPRNRGNWIIDIRFKEGDLFCIKLPIEMTEEHMTKWFAPMREKLEYYKNSKMN